MALRLRGPQKSQLGTSSLRWRCSELVPSLLLAALVALGALIVEKDISARSHVAQTQNPGVEPSPDPPGTIDGSRNPELIRDEVAFRLVFLAIAEPENAPADRKALARAKLRPAGLNEDDTVIFLDALAQFRKELDSLDGRAAAIHDRVFLPRPGSPEWDQLVKLNAERGTAVTETIALLESRLTPMGMQRLRLYVRNAKRGMKVVNE